MRIGLLLKSLLLSWQSARVCCTFCPREWQHAAETNAELPASALLQITKRNAIPTKDIIASEAQQSSLAVVPAPQYSSQLNGGPWFATALQIEASPEYEKGSSNLLTVAKRLFNTTMSVPLVLPTDTEYAPDTTGDTAHFALRLRLKEPASKEASAHEEYRLQTSAKGIEIEAESEHGLFNGLMTLRQLIIQEESGMWRVPAVEVEDRPASEWRGMMLDVSRHFFTAEEVKELLMLMSLYKFNRFHWHLTDDQGWRFPVDSWPKLTEVGQWREGTPDSPDLNSRKVVHAGRYGGAYTHADIQDVISYAASLFIEVVPEVDFPGHVQAAVAAYPELGNTDIPGWKKPEVSSLFGQQNYTLAPTELSFQFVKDVIDEEVKQFPSKYIHLGGDEVQPYQWNASRQAMLFSENKGIGALQIGAVQGSFQKTGMARAALRGKTPLVWEEAADPGKDLSQQAIVMPWKIWSHEAVLEVSRNLTLRGYDVVLCPLAYAYLDQAPGWLTVRQAYLMPLPEGHGHGRVLGGQAEIWTEWMNSTVALHHMTWPRAVALAERFWQGGYGEGAYEDFLDRLVPRLAEFKLMNIKFRPEFKIQLQVQTEINARKLAAAKVSHRP